MMTLYEAAKFFDSAVFSDAFTPTTTFAGQLLPFPDSRNSGPSTRRRILEVAPDVVIPAKRSIKESNTSQVYIVAGASTDLFRGQSIRTKYPVTPAHGLFDYGTIGQFLANTGFSTDLYADLNYIRRFITEDKSSTEGGYEMLFGSSYYLVRGTVVRTGGRYYMATQDSRVEHSGFEIVEAVELRDPIKTQNIVIQGTTYNPTTDSYNSTTVSNATTFVTEGVLDFDHEALGFIPIEAGDKTISVLKTTASTLSVGSTIGNYKVLSKVDRGTYFSTHARRLA
jgi:hypothetical protein